MYIWELGEGTERDLGCKTEDGRKKDSTTPGKTNWEEKEQP